MLTKWNLEQLGRRLKQLQASWENEQRHGIISKNLMLRDYVSGYVLFDESTTSEILQGGHGDASGVLDAINSVLRWKFPDAPDKIVSALVRSSGEHRSYSIVLVRLQS